MHVAFTGILVAEVTEVIPANIPEGYVRVDHTHITLLSSELSKAVRAYLKSNWGASSLPAFPNVTFGETYLADNGKKASLVATCNEQAEIRAWVQQVVAILGLDVQVDPSRVYHVSIANRTGSQFDSVPDPWNHRVNRPIE
ncbi:MAG: hypothetical protein WC657_05705 [Candidatus Paceibacterota bacterium]|jgi:hypothetical protein